MAERDGVRRKDVGKEEGGDAVRPIKHLHVFVETRHSTWGLIASDGRGGEGGHTEVRPPKLRDQTDANKLTKSYSRIAGAKRAGKPERRKKKRERQMSRKRSGRRRMRLPYFISHVGRVTLRE